MIANCECGAWAWAPLQAPPRELEVVLEMTPAGIDLEALYAARFFVCRVCGNFGIQWADAQ